MAKHALLWKFLPRHKAAQKIFLFTNKWVKREASRSRNEVCPFQTRPMACHDHNSKLKRRCALHKCSHTWRAPAVEFWTLEIALSANDDKRIIQPDKINTLAHWYRTGWHGKPTREPTRETWQSDRGGDRVRTEELRQRQGETGKDPTKLGIRETALKHRKTHYSHFLVIYPARRPLCYSFLMILGWVGQTELSYF